MPSTTRSRSTATATRFPSSKRAVAAVPKSSPKPDAITLLFRREVQSLLSTPPALPSHIPADTPVEVLACVERISLSNVQQSVQLCQAGAERWVTRTEGARHYFPRTGRVQKRLRGNEDEETETEPQESMEEDEEDGQDGLSGGVTVRRKKSKRSHSRRETFETPNESERGQASSSSSSARRRDPVAPQKKKKHSRKVRHEDRDGHREDQEFDDGASTETERSHLARTRDPAEPGTLSYIGGGGDEPASFGRGQRKCFGRNNTSQGGRAPTQEGAETAVKSEEADDLASLCGRVGGLEFRSTVDPESEYERTPGPAASTSSGKGKARAD
ncbi:hypothetical protein JCM16303_002241 [Sporobolomyces ruberrimus]